MERHRCANCGCYFNWDRFAYKCPHCGFLNQEAADHEQKKSSYVEEKRKCPICGYLYQASIYSTCPKCKKVYDHTEEKKTVVKEKAEEVYSFKEHIHRIEGVTGSVEEHGHNFSMITIKPKVLKEEKNHVHFIAGETEETAGHKHHFEGYTEPAEQEGENHYHVCHLNTFSKNGHTHEFIIRTELGKNL